MSHRNRRVSLAALLAATAISSGTAGASGFALLEQSASRLGTAFAGTAAAANDATTVFFNPAGITQLEGRQLAAGLASGIEVFPGPHAMTDAALIEFIRRKAETIYHPVGTCRMGTDAGSVVDAAARVHGIDGLRVVDASIMPTIVSGNTNAPTIMIAEKAADMILGKNAMRAAA